MHQKKSATGTVLKNAAKTQFPKPTKISDKKNVKKK